MALNLHDEKKKWLDWAIEIQSLAQAGMTYGHDVYDMERYERLREISAEMLSYKTDIPVEKVKDLFCNETGYQTPKVDTRAAIFEDGKILLVHEKNGTWSLPGGWCDVNQSDRMIAVQDRNKHNLPIYVYGVVKIFIQCSVIDGAFVSNIETTETKYFAKDEIPENLANEKTTKEQILMCFDAYEAKHWKVLFD